MFLQVDVVSFEEFCGFKSWCSKNWLKTEVDVAKFAFILKKSLKKNFFDFWDLNDFESWYKKLVKIDVFQKLVW